MSHSYTLDQLEVHSKIKLAVRADSNSDTGGGDSGNKDSSSAEDMGDDSDGDDNVAVVNDTGAAGPLPLAKTNVKSATLAASNKLWAN
eukprot:1060004-Ditylum_brightwellii.AAC.1